MNLVFTCWICVESDFQREYKIDLEIEINQMSWRRFFILLQGLSLDSHWHRVVRSSMQELTTISDPEEASRAVERIL